MAIALRFYDACIPTNAVNSPYFHKVVDKITSMGHGYKAPNYHALRVNLLRDAKTKLIIDSFRSHWAEVGCTIMGDGWIETRQRPLINFLVYCSKGLSFIKSVNASNFITDAKTLGNFFAEILEFVGPNNVVHMVTDNGANYKVAGRKFSERYPTIRWSPCAAHCINLIMKDMSKMNDVKNVATLASMVTVFIYNHKWTLNWLRMRPGWKEIVHLGATRFATTLIALKSLHDHKYHLQALVLSDAYKKFLKMPKGREVKQIVLDERFWNNSLIFVRIMTPLIRLLCICDSNEKPSLGYVYDGMYRARKGIKNLFKGRKTLYKPYTALIKGRWDRMLRHDLHAVAYWFNLVFQYDQENSCKKLEIMRGVLDVIDKKKLYKKQKLVYEIPFFRDKEQGFSQDLAITSCRTIRPDDWWKIFGYGAPTLQKLAIRILSQKSSSSGCERNWSVFEHIHTKKRNRLEHQRLNDLVYVHYNLRLQNRSKVDKRSYDPIDYESIDKPEFWILEEEEEGELDIDE
ncbi:uncharacterized protein LOC127794663 [Diospyros lotus]|uniref:uncharacterized protein LOC127794663 n=1 Tax=Diospyros lotus TaxID=55363 RepID=UPI002254BFD3|nr:uncharacterized protein LOC127794663 [Diospyros lotus]